MKRLNIFALCLLMVAGRAAAAQDIPLSIPKKVDDDKPVALTEVKLDAERLLAESVVIGSAAGPVWTVKPEEGRRLVRLPVRVPSVDKASSLDSGSLNVARGRFVAYQLVDLRELPEDLSAKEVLVSGAGVDADIPRLTRELIVLPRSVTRPQGAIRWEMERRIVGATLNDNRSLYVLKADIAKVQAMSPGPMPQTSRGENESSRDYSTRRRQELAKWREASTAYRALHRSVLDAETTFHAAPPAMVWALFDLHGVGEELRVSGLAGGQWTIQIEALDAIRAVRSGVGRDADGAIEPQHRARLNQLRQTLDRKAAAHPLNVELIASALSQSKALGQMKPDDEVHQLAKSVLDSEVTRARNDIFKALGLAAHNAVARQMLADVATGLTPELKLARVKAMATLPGGEDQAVAVAQLLASADASLVDAEGPDVRTVLEILLSSAGASSAAAEQIVTAVPFGKMPDERRAEAVAFTVEHARRSGVAARWLVDGLLGGGDEVAGEAMVAMSGALGKSTAAEGEAARPPQPLVIDTVDHVMFSLLGSSQTSTRVQAWNVLPFFRVASYDRGDPEAAVALPERLLAIGLAQDLTPANLVAALARSLDGQRKAAAMMQVVARGSGKALSEAAGSLVAMGDAESVAAGLLQLDDATRLAFAERWYAWQEAEAPLAVKLLNQSSSVRRRRVSEWFAGYVRRGETPPDARWVDTFDTTAQVLETIASAEAEEPGSRASAEAATSALAASAGADDSTVRELMRQLNAGSDKSVEAMTARWQEQRKKLITQRFAKDVGPHALVLIAPQATASGGTTTQRIEIGQVTLVMNEQVLSIANDALTISIPQQRAIRLEKPAEIQNFGNSKANALAWPAHLPATNLSPIGGGVWEGELPLSGGGRVKVRLERLDEDAGTTESTPTRETPGTRGEFGE